MLRAHSIATRPARYPIPCYGITTVTTSGLVVISGDSSSITCLNKIREARLLSRARLLREAPMALR